MYFYLIAFEIISIVSNCKIIGPNNCVSVECTECVWLESRSSYTNIEQQIENEITNIFFFIHMRYAGVAP